MSKMLNGNNSSKGCCKSKSLYNFDGTELTSLPSNITDLLSNLNISTGGDTGGGGGGASEGCPVDCDTVIARDLLEASNIANVGVLLRIRGGDTLISNNTITSDSITTDLIIQSNQNEPDRKVILDGNIETTGDRIGLCSTSVEICDPVPIIGFPENPNLAILDNDDRGFEIDYAFTNTDGDIVNTQGFFGYDKNKDRFVFWKFATIDPGISGFDQNYERSSGDLNEAEIDVIYAKEIRGSDEPLLGNTDLLIDTGTELTLNSAGEVHITTDLTYNVFDKEIHCIGIQSAAAMTKNGEFLVKTFIDGDTNRIELDADNDVLNIFQDTDIVIRTFNNNNNTTGIEIDSGDRIDIKAMNDILLESSVGASLAITEVTNSNGVVFPIVKIIPELRVDTIKDCDGNTLLSAEDIFCVENIRVNVIQPKDSDLFILTDNLDPAEPPFLLPGTITMRSSENIIMTTANNITATAGNNFSVTLGEDFEVTTDSNIRLVSESASIYRTVDGNLDITCQKRSTYSTIEGSIRIFSADTSTYRTTTGAINITAAGRMNLTGGNTIEMVADGNNSNINIIGGKGILLRSRTDDIDLRTNQQNDSIKLISGRTLISKRLQFSGASNLNSIGGTAAATIWFDNSQGNNRLVTNFQTRKRPLVLGPTPANSPVRNNAIVKFDDAIGHRIIDTNIIITGNNDNFLRIQRIGTTAGRLLFESDIGGSQIYTFQPDNLTVGNYTLNLPDEPRIVATRTDDYIVLERTANDLRNKTLCSQTNTVAAGYLWDEDDSLLRNPLGIKVEIVNTPNSINEILGIRSIIGTLITAEWDSIDSFVVVSLQDAYDAGTTIDVSDGLGPVNIESTRAVVSSVFQVGNFDTSVNYFKIEGNSVGASEGVITIGESLFGLPFSGSRLDIFGFNTTDAAALRAGNKDIPTMLTVTPEPTGTNRHLFITGDLGFDDVGPASTMITKTSGIEFRDRSPAIGLPTTATSGGVITSSNTIWMDSTDDNILRRDVHYTVEIQSDNVTGGSGDIAGITTNEIPMFKDGSNTRGQSRILGSGMSINIAQTQFSTGGLDILTGGGSVLTQNGIINTGSGTLDVGGITTLGSTLTVAGTTTLNGFLDANLGGDFRGGIYNFLIAPPLGEFRFETSTSKFHRIGTSGVVSGISGNLFIPGSLSGNDTFVFEDFTQTLSNKTLVCPEIDKIDSSVNSATVLDFSGGGGTNFIGITGSGINPTISGLGINANIDIQFQSKGDAGYCFFGTVDTAAEVKLYEDTSFGTSYIGIRGPEDVTGAGGTHTYILPDSLRGGPTTIVPGPPVAGTTGDILAIKTFISPTETELHWLEYPSPTSIISTLGTLQAVYNTSITNAPFIANIVIDTASGKPVKLEERAPNPVGELFIVDTDVGTAGDIFRIDTSGATYTVEVGDYDDTYMIVNKNVNFRVVGDICVNDDATILGLVKCIEGVEFKGQAGTNPGTIQDNTIWLDNTDPNGHLPFRRGDPDDPYNLENNYFVEMTETDYCSGDNLTNRIALFADDKNRLIKPSTFSIVGNDLTVPAGGILFVDTIQTAPAGTAGVKITDLRIDSGGVGCYIISPISIPADLTLTLPDPGASDTFVYNTLAANLSNKTLITPNIQDLSTSFNYEITPTTLTANRDAILPPLTGDDTFVFECQQQDLKNKRFTSNIILVGSTVKNVPNPVDPCDAVPKKYADLISSMLTAVQAVRVATVDIMENLTVGASMPVGATYVETPAPGKWTFSNFSPDEIDGITLVDGDRVLIKNEGEQHIQRLSNLVAASQFNSTAVLATDYFDIYIGPTGFETVHIRVWIDSLGTNNTPPSGAFSGSILNKTIAIDISGLLGPPYTDLDTRNEIVSQLSLDVDFTTYFSIVAGIPNNEFIITSLTDGNNNNSSVTGIEFSVSVVEGVNGNQEQSNITMSTTPRAFWSVGNYFDIYTDLSFGPTTGFRVYFDLTGADPVPGAPLPAGFDPVLIQVDLSGLALLATNIDIANELRTTLNTHSTGTSGDFGDYFITPVGNFGALTTITTNTEIDTTTVFGSGFDISAVTGINGVAPVFEESTFTLLNATSNWEYLSNANYFDLNSGDNEREYRFWYDRSGLNQVPSSGGRTLVRIDISGLGGADVPGIETRDEVNGVNGGLDFVAVVNMADPFDTEVTMTNSLNGSTIAFNAPNMPIGVTMTTIQTGEGEGNGIFIVTDPGMATGSIPIEWCRSTDFDDLVEVVNGKLVFVSEGVVNEFSTFISTRVPSDNANASLPVTVGQEIIEFTFFQRHNPFNNLGCGLVSNLGTVEVVTSGGTTTTPTVAGVTPNNPNFQGVIVCEDTIPNGNLYLRSSSLSGQVLISTGTPTDEPEYGAIDISGTSPAGITGTLHTVLGGVGIPAVTLFPAANDNKMLYLDTTTTFPIPEWKLTNTLTNGVMLRNGGSIPMFSLALPDNLTATNMTLTTPTIECPTIGDDGFGNFIKLDNGTIIKSNGVGDITLPADIGEVLLDCAIQTIKNKTIDSSNTLDCPTTTGFMFTNGGAITKLASSVHLLATYNVNIPPPPPSAISPHTSTLLTRDSVDPTSQTNKIITSESNTVYTSGFIITGALNPEIEIDTSTIPVNVTAPQTGQIIVTTEYDGITLGTAEFQFYTLNSAYQAYDQGANPSIPPNILLDNTIGGISIQDDGLFGATQNLLEVTDVGGAPIYFEVNPSGATFNVPINITNILTDCIENITSAGLKINGGDVGTKDGFVLIESETIGAGITSVTPASGEIRVHSLNDMRLLSETGNIHLGPDLAFPFVTPATGNIFLRSLEDIDIRSERHIWIIASDFVSVIENNLLRLQAGADPGQGYVQLLSSFGATFLPLSFESDPGNIYINSAKEIVEVSGAGSEKRAGYNPVGFGGIFKIQAEFGGGGGDTPTNPGDAFAGSITLSGANQIYGLSKDITTFEAGIASQIRERTNIRFITALAGLPSGALDELFIDLYTGPGGHPGTGNTGVGTIKYFRLWFITNTSMLQMPPTITLPTLGRTIPSGPAKIQAGYWGVDTRTIADEVEIIPIDFAGSLPGTATIDDMRDFLLTVVNSHTGPSGNFMDYFFAFPSTVSGFADFVATTSGNIPNPVYFPLTTTDYIANEFIFGSIGEERMALAFLTPLAGWSTGALDIFFYDIYTGPGVHPGAGNPTVGTILYFRIWFITSVTQITEPTSQAPGGALPSPPTISGGFWNGFVDTRTGADDVEIIPVDFTISGAVTANDMREYLLTILTNHTSPNGNFIEYFDTVRSSAPIAVDHTCGVPGDLVDPIDFDSGFPGLFTSFTFTQGDDTFVNDGIIRLISNASFQEAPSPGSEPGGIYLDSASEIEGIAVSNIFLRAGASTSTTPQQTGVFARIQSGDAGFLSGGFIEFKSDTNLLSSPLPVIGGISQSDGVIYLLAASNVETYTKDNIVMIAGTDNNTPLATGGYVKIGAGDATTLPTTPIFIDGNIYICGSDNGTSIVEVNVGDKLLVNGNGEFTGNVSIDGLISETNGVSIDTNLATSPDIPTIPTAGQAVIYINTDDNLVIRDDNGVDTIILSGIDTTLEQAYINGFDGRIDLDNFRKNIEFVDDSTPIGGIFNIKSDINENFFRVHSRDGVKIGEFENEDPQITGIGREVEILRTDTPDVIASKFQDVFGGIVRAINTSIGVPLAPITDSLTGFIFDILVPGSVTDAEITDIFVVDGATLVHPLAPGAGPARFFEISTPASTYYFWFNTNSGEVDPLGAGISVEVNISPTSTKNDVTNALRLSFESTGAFASQNFITNARETIRISTIPAGVVGPFFIDPLSNFVSDLVRIGTVAETNILDITLTDGMRLATGVAGLYFSIADTFGTDFQFWYQTGTEVAPPVVPPLATQVMITVLTTDTPNQIVIKTITEVNAVNAGSSFVSRNLYDATGTIRVTNEAKGTIVPFPVGPFPFTTSFIPVSVQLGNSFLREVTEIIPTNGRSLIGGTPGGFGYYFNLRTVSDIYYFWYDTGNGEIDPGTGGGPLDPFPGSIVPTAVPIVVLPIDSALEVAEKTRLAIDIAVDFRATIELARISLINTINGALALAPASRIENMPLKTTLITPLVATDINAIPQPGSATTPDISELELVKGEDFTLSERYAYYLLHFEGDTLVTDPYYFWFNVTDVSLHCVNTCIIGNTRVNKNLIVEQGILEPAGIEFTPQPTAINPASGAVWTGIEANTVWLADTNQLRFGAENLVTSTALSSTDNAIVRFDGTTGSKFQDSGITIDDNNILQGADKISSERYASGVVYYTNQASVNLADTVTNPEGIHILNTDINLTSDFTLPPASNSGCYYTFKNESPADELLIQISNKVQVTNVVGGLVTDASDIDTGFNIVTSTQGALPVEEISDVILSEGNLLQSFDAGLFFTTSSTTTDYYIWYQTGTEVDPGIAQQGGVSGTGVRVDILSTATVDDVADATRTALTSVDTPFVANSLVNVILSTPGAVISTATAGTTSFIIDILQTGTGALQEIFDLNVDTGATLQEGPGNPGQYWTVSSTTIQYYVWYSTELGEIDPVPIAGATPILVSVLTTDSAAEVARKTRNVLAGVGVVFIVTRKFKVTTIVLDDVTDSATGTSGFTVETIDGVLNTLPEITKITPLGPGAVVAGLHWLISSSAIDYYVWYNTGADPDPLVAGRTGIEVGITAVSTQSEIEEATKTALNTLPFSPFTIDIQLRVTNTSIGAVVQTIAPPSASSPTIDFVVTIIQPGTQGLAEVDDIVVPAGPGLVTGIAGLYWLISTATTNYYVWYQTGTEVDPLITPNAIPVVVLPGASVSDVADATVLALNSVIGMPFRSIKSGTFSVEVTLPAQSPFTPTTDFIVTLAIEGNNETAQIVDIVVPDGPTLATGTIGLYWRLDSPAVNAPTNDFYIWYQTGTEIDPTVTANAIPVVVSPLATISDVAEATITAINSVIGTPFNAVKNLRITNNDLGAANDTTDGTSPFIVSTFQDGADAQPEITDIFVGPATTLINPVLPGFHFFISSTTVDYYVWYDTGNGEIDPAPVGRVGIPIVLLPTDEEEEVASKTADALNLLPTVFSAQSILPIDTLLQNEFAIVIDTEVTTTFGTTNEWIVLFKGFTGNPGAIVLTGGNTINQDVDGRSGRSFILNTTANGTSVANLPIPGVNGRLYQFRNISTTDLFTIEDQTGVEITTLFQNQYAICQELDLDNNGDNEWILLFKGTITPDDIFEIDGFFAVTLNLATIAEKTVILNTTANGSPSTVILPANSISGRVYKFRNRTLEDNLIIQKPDLSTITIIKPGETIELVDVNLGLGLDWEVLSKATFLTPGVVTSTALATNVADFIANTFIMGSGSTADSTYELDTPGSGGRRFIFKNESSFNMKINDHLATEIVTIVKNEYVEVQEGDRSSGNEWILLSRGTINPVGVITRTLPLDISTVSVDTIIQNVGTAGSITYTLPPKDTSLRKLTFKNFSGDDMIIERAIIDGGGIVATLTTGQFAIIQEFTLGGTLDWIVLFQA